ncbi:MAG: 4Fe-4S dicluster domain-containing protein [Spirochaetota bacterium]
MTAELGLYIDLDRCYGCGTCEMACTMEKSLPPGQSHIHVTEVRNGPGLPPSRDFVPVACQHCDEPACVNVCATGALYRDGNGLVVFNADACTACGLCEEACPYGAIILDASNGQPRRCDLCADRQVAGLLPACVQHCPGRAMDIWPPQAVNQGSIGPVGVEPSRPPKKVWSAGKLVYLSRKGGSILSHT